MTKPTKWHVRPAKNQISLAVRLKKARVLSYPLSAEESLCYQTERMPRLIWVFTGRTVILLVLSCGGSFLHYDNTHLLVFVKIYGTFFISVVYSNIQGSQENDLQMKESAPDFLEFTWWLRSEYFLLYRTITQMSFQKCHSKQIYLFIYYPMTSNIITSPMLTAPLKSAGQTHIHIDDFLSLLVIIIWLCNKIHENRWLFKRYHFCIGYAI